ncbi:MAG: Na/Pi cotransporter family protein [Nitrospirae bacterium]|nr:Na/Pi cotransporter family protein [Nitrospirota bacterium]
MVRDILSLTSALGIFFFGISIMGDNLKLLTGPGFKALIGAMSRKVLTAGFWGLLAGFITQSSRVVTVITAYLVSGELLLARNAIPISLWSNCGDSLIVIAAVLPYEYLVLSILSLTGILYSFNLFKRYKHIFGALFGIGLFLLGLIMVQSAAAPFADTRTFREVLGFVLATPHSAFIVGFLLTCITQSSMGVVLLALTLPGIGSYGWAQLFMLIIGTHVASSLMMSLLSFQIHGRARQIAMVQVFFNPAGAAVFIPLIYAEYYGRIPMIHSLIASLASRTSDEATYMVILYNASTALILTIFRDGYFRFITWLTPLKEAQSTYEPRYINSAAVNEPETARLLVEKEQLLLIKRFGDYMGVLRSSMCGRSELPVSDQLHKAFKSVSDKIKEFLASALKNGNTAKTMEQLLNVVNRQSLLAEIEEELYSISLHLKDGVPAAENLYSNIIESFDFIIITLYEAVENLDPVELQFLSVITADSEGTMETIRKDYLQQEDKLSGQQRYSVLYITNIFENIIRNIHRYGRLVSQSLNRNA